MPNSKKVMSNRGVLLTSITLLLLTGFIVTHLVSFYYLKASLKTSIVENELPKSSVQVYSEITNNILPALVASSMLANDHYIGQWLKGKKEDIPAITDYLNQVKQNNNATIAFLVSDDTQQYYNSEGFTVFEKRGDPMAQWYFDFIASGKKSEINLGPNIDATQTPTLFINHRVTVADENVGVVGLGIELDVIDRILNRYQQSHNQHIYFITVAGDIIFRSNLAGLDQQSLLSIPGMRGALSSDGDNNLSFFEYSNSQGHYLLNLRYIPELKWWMLIEQDQDVTFEGISKILSTNALISLGIIVIFIIIAIWVIRHFHRELEILASTDALTGLDNRQSFEAKMELTLAQSHRHQVPISVLMIDIDRFKAVNDKFGHQAGDKVLQMVANIIKTGVRESDYTCRWGGEEFVVTAYNSPVQAAQLLAEKLRSRIENSDVFHSEVTVSIGVAQLGAKESIESALHRADIALYKAKDAGRNQVCAE